MVFDEELNDFLMGVEGLEVVQTHALDSHLHDFLFANAKATLLFGQIVFAGINQHTLRNKSNDFAAGDAQTAILGTTAHLVETFVYRGHLDGGDVHRHLCDAVVLDIPADGLGALEGTGNHDGLAVLILHRLAAGLAAFALGTALLADIKSNGVGTTGAGGVEVVVDGHQKIAGTHLGGTGLRHMRVPLVGAEVGLPLLGTQTGAQALILASAAVGQVAALGKEGGVLVCIDGNVQLVADALTQFVGIFHHLFHTDVGYRNQGAHIRGTLTGMSPVVVAHIDQLRSLLHHAESSLAARFGLADESDHGTVRGGTGVYVKQFNTFYLFNLGGHLIDDIHVAALADIGHALNKLFHKMYIFILYLIISQNLAHKTNRTKGLAKIRKLCDINKKSFAPRSCHPSRRPFPPTGINKKDASTKKKRTFAK